ASSHIADASRDSTHPWSPAPPPAASRQSKHSAHASFLPPDTPPHECRRFPSASARTPAQSDNESPAPDIENPAPSNTSSQAARKQDRPCATPPAPSTEADSTPRAAPCSQLPKLFPAPAPDALQTGRLPPVVR